MFRVAPYNQGVRRNTEFDNLFNMMDRVFAEEPRKEFVRGFKVDILDQDDSYVFEADLPGVKKEDITVDYKDNQLILQVDVTEDEEKKDLKYIRKERSFSSMKRVFRVKDIQIDGITAKFENGVLSVVAPKLVEEETSISIDVQ